eukprot:1368-Heterococcus_DN1.PRE.2
MLTLSGGKKISERVAGLTPVSLVMVLYRQSMNSKLATHAVYHAYYQVAVSRSADHALRLHLKHTLILDTCEGQGGAATSRNSIAGSGSANATDGSATFTSMVQTMLGRALTVSVRSFVHFSTMGINCCLGQ